MTDINNSQDVMDSRDIIERIEELRDERTVLTEELAAAEECVKYHHPDGVDFAKEDQPAEVMEFRRCRDELAAWEDESAEELAALEAFVAQFEGYGDWAHGATVIRESHFQDYAQELAEECGMVTKGSSWPNNCIDWEEAANQLKQDYTEAEFDGVTYLMRA